MDIESFAKGKLQEIEQKGLRRFARVTTREDGVRVTRNERVLLSFCCNDYLGLSHHPLVKKAALQAVENYGVGAGASRLITGENPLYAELEQKLARLKDTESAIVFGSGYLANSGIIPVFVGPDDLIIADQYSHACMVAGAQLSKAPTHYFRHNDIKDCLKLLQEHRHQARNCLILTEGVFSMDGDIAPLAELAALAHEYQAWILTDDAHALGVIGEGRGSSFAFGETRLNIPLQMGTLSKAIGGYGGYLCASANICELMRNRARSLIYTTGLPPATLAAAAQALEIISADKELTTRPLARARLFTQELGIKEAESQIVPLEMPDIEQTMKASAQLEEKGFLVAAIRPPTVPTPRLRFAFSALHNEEDVRALARAVKSVAG